MKSFYFFLADLSVSLTATSARTVSLFLGESILRKITFGFGEISIKPSAWQRITWKLKWILTRFFKVKRSKLNQISICYMYFYPSSWEGQIISSCKLWEREWGEWGEWREWENKEEKNKLMMHLLFQVFNSR